MTQPRKTRVLVVDDSTIARCHVSRILREDPMVEIVGEAANGREAVELAWALDPDVITMDVIMPVMDGFEATREIMRTRPTRIVVVTGVLDGKEAEFCLKALEAGALSVVQKPPPPWDPRHAVLADQFLSTVQALSHASAAVGEVGSGASLLEPQYRSSRASESGPFEPSRGSQTGDTSFRTSRNIEGSGPSVGGRGGAGVSSSGISSSGISSSGISSSGISSSGVSSSGVSSSGYSTPAHSSSSLLESVGGSSMSEPVPYNSIILEMESGPFSRATPISDPAPFREMSAMSTGLPSFRRAVGSVRVVAVTASLQGLTSLHRLIHALPADFPVPVLVSHEITRSNDRGLAEWLNETAHVHVREARMDDGIYGGTVYLAPVHRYFGVSADETAILADEPPPGMFASASSSFLFSSIARVYGTAALAVVLSGSRGPDLLGLRSLHMAGSRILVDQDALDQRSSLRPEGLASFAHTVVSPTVLPSEVYDSVFHQALG